MTDETRAALLSRLDCAEAAYEEMERERDEWKAQAEAAARKLAEWPKLADAAVEAYKARLAIATEVLRAAPDDWNRSDVWHMRVAAFLEGQPAAPDPADRVLAWAGTAARADLGRAPVCVNPRCGMYGRTDCPDITQPAQTNQCPTCILDVPLSKAHIDSIRAELALREGKK